MTARHVTDESRIFQYRGCSYRLRGSLFDGDLAVFGSATRDQLGKVRRDLGQAGDTGFLRGADGLWKNASANCVMADLAGSRRLKGIRIKSGAISSPAFPASFAGPIIAYDGARCITEQVGLNMYMYVHIYVYIYVSIYLSIYLSIHLHTHLHVPGALGCLVETAKPRRQSLGACSPPRCPG